MPAVRRFAALAVLTPLLLAGAACGGDDDDTSSGSGDRLTKAEFIKQGDAICAELNDGSEKVADPGQTVDELVKFLDEIVALVEAARDDVAALNPPEDGGNVKRVLVKQLEAGVTASRKAQEAAKKNDQAAVNAALNTFQTAGEEIKDTTGAYGFKVCSEAS